MPCRVCREHLGEGLDSEIAPLDRMNSTEEKSYPLSSQDGEWNEEIRSLLFFDFLRRHCAVSGYNLIGFVQPKGPPRLDASSLT